MGLGFRMPWFVCDDSIWFSGLEFRVQDVGMISWFLCGDFYILGVRFRGP